MRAYEFIPESRDRKPMRKSLTQAASNLTTYDALDNPYLAYRFGVALAGSPATTMPKQGPFGSKFTMIDYSEADTTIRQAAEKTLGISPASSTGKGSEELTDTTNVVSPVAKPKKNQYGV